MRGEQAIFNLEIKKKSGLSINPDIHHSKVFSSEDIISSNRRFAECYVWFTTVPLTSLSDQVRISY